MGPVEGPPVRSVAVPATRILLLRHGQSEWNALGRWQGQADPPLSAVGRAQAVAASRSVGTVDAIVASDLVRAYDTALVIAGAIGAGPVVVEAALRERDAGEWSGLTRRQIHGSWPGYLDDGRRPPGWESDDALLARVLPALGRIAALAPGGAVLAVTHGGVVYALEAHLGLPDAGRLANVAGRTVHVDGDRVTAGERVLLVDGDDAPVTVPSAI